MLVFNFWEQQRVSKRYTSFYLGIYGILLTLGGAGFEALLRFGLDAQEIPGLTAYIPALFFAGTSFLIGMIYYYYYTSTKFDQITGSIFNASPLNEGADFPSHKMLANIVEEMAIASSLPIPKILIIPVSEINSLTLGSGANNYAILVTQGALENLTRDELQAMIGYEMSHVKENNLKLNMRLSAMLMSFYCIMNFSARFLSNYKVSRSSSSKSKKDNKGNHMFVIAIAFCISGAFLYVFGAILQAVIAHQRVYLSDASAVQFTRNGDALRSLLLKIKMQNKSELPRTAEGLANFYLSGHSTTHPTIDARLARLNISSAIVV